jgi:hypothetical protein
LKQQAVRLQRAIAERTGNTPQLRFGGPGSLDIIIDGETVFSKKQAGRIPSVAEGLAIVETRLPSA